MTEVNKNKDIYKHISELVRIHELEEILVSKDKQAHIFTIAEVEFYKNKDGYRRYRNITKDEYQGKSLLELKKIINKKINQIEGLKKIEIFYEKYRSQFIDDITSVATNQLNLFKEVKLRVKNEEKKSLLIFTEIIYSFSFASKSVENLFFKKLDELYEKNQALYSLRLCIPKEMDNDRANSIRSEFNVRVYPNYKDGFEKHYSEWRDCSTALMDNLNINHNLNLDFSNIDENQNTPSTLALKERFNSSYSNTSWY